MLDFDELDGADAAKEAGAAGADRSLPSKGGRFYRVVHRPRIAVRAQPSVKAEILYALVHGDVIHVSAELASGWVVLAPDEQWAHQIEGGYVLVDGKEVGLGRLLDPLGDGDVTEDTWPYALALRRAAALEVPFCLNAKQVRPMDAKRLQQRWLSAWHEPGAATEPVRWLPAGPLPRGAAARPRLCVALLVRGVPAEAVASFIRYHHAAGFERVALFFDAPNDATEAAAIEAALRCAASPQASAAEVKVHLCTAEWWEEEKRESRFYLRKASPDKVYREMVELNDDVHDVQARQCLAIERAIREAHRDGFDWLLHIDSDEVLLLPESRDARHFFASVPAEVDQVIFNNLEGVPERLDIGDWFREVTLFKVHQSLLKEAASEKEDTSAEGLKRRQKREEWRKRKIAKGSDPDDLKDNRTFDALMLGIRMTRRGSAFNFDFDLPAPDSDSDGPSDSDEEKKDSEKPWRNFLPAYYNAYSNGKAACRLRRGVAPPLPIGVHRCTSDSNSKLANLKCTGAAAPVVLHYANCGFEAWKRKYEILSRGHGTEDGGFSITRKGIVSMRAHLAHRDLLRRGSEEQFEAYYRTYIMCSEFGELAHFASHGLVVRTNAVRALLGEAAA